MRAWRGVVLPVVLLVACVSAEVSLSDGDGYSLPDDSAADRLQEAMEALLESCRRDVSHGHAHAEEWGEVVRGRHLAVRYDKPRKLEISGVPLEVAQIVVPLPEDDLPEKIWVRAQGQIRALSRFNIDRLSDLVCDEALAVTGDEPYRRLCERAEGGS